MNPWDLSASELLIWGLVLHLIADWPLQNDWMANNKMKRSSVWTDTPAWWNRHTAAYVHAGIHGLLLALVFGWAAIPLAFIHLIIDCRWPVAKWSKLMGQTQPMGKMVLAEDMRPDGIYDHARSEMVLIYDVGTEVRFWTDQVFHITCIAIAALLVGSL